MVVAHTFSELFSDVTARSPKVNQASYSPVGRFPIIDQGASEIAGYTDDDQLLTRVERPVILFGDHTRRFKHVTSDFVVGADGVKVLQPHAEIDSRYAYRYLESIDIPGAGYSRHFKFLKEVRVPLPPLPEQRRIAAILDQADALHAKRRRSLALLDELKEGMFVKAVGQVDHGRWSWPTRRVDEFGRVQLGRQRAPKYQTGAFSRPYVRVANVYEDRLELADLLCMDFDARDFQQYRLKVGDILLNEGQSTELVGRPAMWRGEIDACCFQNTLIRFTADERQYHPEFALSVILHMYRSGEFSRVSSKTSNVAHLGASRFAAMSFPVVPKHIQAQVIESIARVRKMQVRASAALDSAQAMFASLQHRSFNGQL